MLASCLAVCIAELQWLQLNKNSSYNLNSRTDPSCDYAKC